MRILSIALMLIVVYSMSAEGNVYCIKDSTGAGKWFGGKWECPKGYTQSDETKEK